MNFNNRTDFFEYKKFLDEILWNSDDFCGHEILEETYIQ